MRISATYGTRRASWYESMGIMVLWEAWNEQGGTDPFTRGVDESGHVTHGHLAGGQQPRRRLSAGDQPEACSRLLHPPGRDLGVRLQPGGLLRHRRRPLHPAIRQGQSLTFVNNDASPLSPGNPLNPSRAYMASIFNTVTACQNPCGLNTANGGGGYDPGQLGFGTPAVGKLRWSTPAGLKPGTYTFFCRIHPFMRGRVPDHQVAPSSAARMTPPLMKDINHQHDHWAALR